MQIKTVAIAGAGGIVGSLVTKRLIDDGDFEVTALLRPSSAYTAPAGVKTAVADFTDGPSLEAALQGQDAVLCCINPSAVQLSAQKILIDAAIAAGVKLFFADEYGGDLLSKNFALQPSAIVGEKVAVRQYLQQVAAEGRISWTALNGGGFFDMWLARGVGGVNVPERKATIYDSGNVTLCWTPTSMIVEAVRNMLRNPGPILNRAIFIAGVRDLSQNSMLAAVEAQTGETFAVERVAVDPIKEAALEAIKKGELLQGVMGLARDTMFSDKNSVANFWDRVENEAVGIKPVTVEEAVKDVLSSMKSG